MYQGLDEPQPPAITGEQLTRIKRRGRRIRSVRTTVAVAALGVLVAGGTAAALVTSSTGHSAQPVKVLSPSPDTTSATTAPATTAPATSPTSAPATSAPETAVTSATQHQADAMLDALILPSGASRVSPLGGPDFSSPFQEPACQPLSDASGYWTVPGTMAEVYTYLRAHAPTWIPWTNYGTPGPAPNPSSNGYGVAGNPTTPGYQAGDELVAEIYQITSELTGVRADGLALPPDASCTNSGGPAGVEPITTNPG